MIVTMWPCVEVSTGPQCHCVFTLGGWETPADLENFRSGRCSIEKGEMTDGRLIMDYSYDSCF